MFINLYYHIVLALMFSMRAAGGQMTVIQNKVEICFAVLFQDD